MAYQNWRSKYGHIIQNTPSLLDGKRRRGTLKEKIIITFLNAAASFAIQQGVFFCKEPILIAQIL